MSTGLQYMNSRYYNPSTGRFLSQDSYSGNPYDPWTQHLYSYCGNNPTNFIDPTGHTFMPILPDFARIGSAVAAAMGGKGTGKSKTSIDEKQKDVKNKITDLIKDTAVYKQCENTCLFYSLENSKDATTSEFQLSISNIREEEITNKEGYNTYIDLCLIKDSKESRDQALIMSIAEEIPIVDKVIPLLNYVIETYSDPTNIYNGDFYDKLGGTYTLADFTTDADWDIMFEDGSHSGGKHAIYKGTIVVGNNVCLPDNINVENPLNFIVYKCENPW